MLVWSMATVLTVLRWSSASLTKNLQETPRHPQDARVFHLRPEVPLPQLFLKRTAMSLQEGPPVAAEDLRPNCSVRAATGGWLEVQCSDVLDCSCQS